MAIKKRKSPAPRLRDIAEKAGVSVPTVSLALADNPRISLQTKRLVWRISEDIGYRGWGHPTLVPRLQARID